MTLEPKSTFELTNELITAVSHFAWPGVVLVIFYLLRDEIVKIFPRVTKASIMGQEFDIEPMTKEEILEKKETEITELKAADSTSLNSNQVTVEAVDELSEKKDYRELVSNAELAALSKIETTFDFPIQRNIRLGRYMFDAFGISPKGHPYFFEVKVYPAAEDEKGSLKIQKILHGLSVTVPQMASAVRQYAEEQRPRTVPTIMIIVVVNTSQPLDALMQELARFKSMLNVIDPRVAVRFQCFNLPKLLGQDNS